MGPSDGKDSHCRDQLRIMAQKKLKKFEACDS
jgi:hypothetical protein